ncbi:MAG: putative toxin-antitoxin system toxin component, PIN family [Thermodesulfovibrionales bacterium]
MKVVVDTNIVFSAFLSKNSKYRELLFDDKYEFYSPNFVFLEIFKHKEKILKCTKESEEEVYGFLGKMLKRVSFVKEEVVSVENYEKANALCREIDENDTPFLALALEIDGYLLTGDEKLKKVLKIKGFDRFLLIKM